MKRAEKNGRSRSVFLVEFDEDATLALKYADDIARLTEFAEVRQAVLAHAAFLVLRLERRRAAAAANLSEDES